MSSCLAWLSWSWLLAGTAAATAAEQPWQTVDRIVAVVDNHIITQTDLAVEAQVAAVIHAGESGLQTSWQQADLQAILDYVIHEMLVAASTRRSRLEQLDATETAELLWKFRQNFGSAQIFSDFLARYQLDEAVLTTILQRHVICARAVEARLKQQKNGADIKAWLEELRSTADIRLLDRQDQLNVP